MQATVHGLTKSRTRKPPGLIVDSVASGWEHRYTPEAPGNPAPIPTTPSILHQPLGLTPSC